MVGRAGDRGCEACVVGWRRDGGDDGRTGSASTAWRGQGGMLEGVAE